jgi:hypothetical protein
VFDLPIDLAAVGAVAASVGGVSGMLLGHWLRRSGTAPRIVDPRVCGCGHHYALHDVEDAAKCWGEVRRIRYHKNGARSGHEWVQCPCRHYTGEVPLDLSKLDLFGMPMLSTEHHGTDPTEGSSDDA